MHRETQCVISWPAGTGVAIAGMLVVFSCKNLGLGIGGCFASRIWSEGHRWGECATVWPNVNDTGLGAC